MNQRLIYKLGSYMPKWLRIIYYIILVVTLIYVVFRALEFILVSIQKIGAFIFDNRNYWTVIMCLFILALGTFIVAQFVIGMDPWGRFTQWLIELFNRLIWRG